MPGLSSLQVNIKDQPHNLAWINEEEQALLKDLGGSGRPGPMGIPAYDFTDRGDSELGNQPTKGDWNEPDDFHPDDFTYNAKTDEFSLPKNIGSKNETEKSRQQFASDLDVITGGENAVNFSKLDLNKMEEMYEDPDKYGVGYNDFVNMGFFDKSEAADLQSMREDALEIQKYWNNEGYPELTVGVDNDFNFSYDGPFMQTVGPALSEIAKSAVEANKFGAFGAINPMSVIQAMARQSGLSEGFPNLNILPNNLDFLRTKEQIEEREAEEREAKLADNEVYFDGSPEYQAMRAKAQKEDDQLQINEATEAAMEFYDPFEDVETGSSKRLYPESTYLPKLVTPEAAAKKPSAMNNYWKSINTKLSNEENTISKYFRSLIKSPPDPNEKIIEDIYSRATGGTVAQTSEEIFADIYGLTPKESTEKFLFNSPPPIKNTIEVPEEPPLSNKDFGYFEYDPERIGIPLSIFENYYGDDSGGGSDNPSNYVNKIRHEGYTDHNWGDTWGAPEWEPEPGMPWTLEMIENHPYLGESGNLGFGQRFNMGSEDGEDGPMDKPSFKEAPPYRLEDVTDYDIFTNPSKVEDYYKDSNETPARNKMKNYFANYTGTTPNSGTQLSTQYDNKDIYKNMIDKYSFKAPEFSEEDNLYINNTGEEDSFSKLARKNREAALNTPKYDPLSEITSSIDYLDNIYGIK